MRVISLTQPWSSLMAWDEKRFETRDWQTSYRGPLAIHASKGFPPDCRSLCYEEPFLSVLKRHIDGEFIISLKGTGPTTLPLGQILCVVDLIDCIPTAPEGHPKRLTRVPSAPPAEHEPHFGNYAAGRFVWVTKDVRRLRWPIAAKGALGLWEYDTAEIEAAIREAA